MAEENPITPVGKWAAYARAKRQRRMDAGLCTSCGKARGDNGTLVCDGCRDKLKARNTRVTERKRAARPPKPTPVSADMKAYKRAWRLRMNAAGICVSCGSRPAVAGRSRCEACCQKDTANYERYGKAKYRGRSARVNGEAKEQRRRWDAEGKCNWCGGGRDDLPRKRCQACNEYSRAKLRQRARKNKGKGLCRCGKEPSPGRRKCPACLEQSRAEYRRLMETNPAAVLAKMHKRRAKKSGNGGSFTALEWNAIKRLQDFTCPCCGKREPEIKLTVDHVIPVNQGGPSWAWNLQGLCESCNKSKGDNHVDYRPGGPWISNTQQDSCTLTYKFPGERLRHRPTDHVRRVQI